MESAAQVEEEQKQKLINKVITEKDDFDVVQKSIGVLGRWHILICVSVFLVKFPVAWHQLSIVFLAPPVNFTCVDNETDSCDSNCQQHIFDRSLFSETIITQWDLVCDKAYLANMAQTVTMLGILSGNMLFGYFSDRFGRRNPLIGAVILQVVSGIGVAFSHWFPLFLILRFSAALATGGTMVMSFVLVTELVGTKWRTTFGILYQIPFNLGHLTLPLFAYFLRDWRYFQIAISLPPVILTSYYFFLPESPRWLMSVGKKENAIAELERAAHHNKLPTASIREDVTNYMAKKSLNEEKQGGNFIDLVRTPIMRTYTVCLGFNWFACGLCFFGGAQYIGQLGGNIFINVALSAIIQVPSTFFAIWAVKAWGRKYTLIFSDLTAGISCILIGLVPTQPPWIRSALSCVDMFGLAVCFPTAYIYSGELFPTVVRNIGVGTSSMCARVGSMAAPFIAGLVLVQEWLPPAIFGVVPLVGAALCLKLPETLDCKLPDTIEEAESFVKRKFDAKNETEMRSQLLSTEKDDLDVVQKSIGVLGRWHVVICVAIILVKFPVAWHQLSIVFLAPPVSFWCVNNETDSCDSDCQRHIFDRSIFSETIITQWDLVCEKAYLANMAQTVTMLGVLFGNMVFGYFSDRFGRRNPLIGAVILQIISGIGVAFSDWLPLFFILRFCAALATGGAMVISFVLIMELIGTKWRTTIGILYQIPFNVGHLTLPLFAYFLRDWRFFQIAISLPSIVLISYYIFLPESPRWLMSVGKKEKAIKELERAANHNKLPTASIRDDVTNYMSKKSLNEEKEGGNIADLVRTPIMRMYTVCVGFNWLVCGLCFFGSAQYIGQLGGNIFINVALSAVIQIPSTFFSIWAVKTWGRKHTLIFSNLTVGISCILIGLVPAQPPWIRSALSCVDMFGLAISFPTVYIYSGELFPTVVRNIGVGTASMCARVGSMAAPFIAGLVSVQEWLPPVIFGVVPLVGAVLCLKLPETLDCKLPDTIEEAEEFCRKTEKIKNETEMKINGEK